jgi:hypothetical protein
MRTIDEIRALHASYLECEGMCRTCERDASQCGPGAWESPDEVAADIGMLLEYIDELHAVDREMLETLGKAIRRREEQLREVE